MGNIVNALMLGSNGQHGYYLNELLEREKVDYLCISQNGNAMHGDVGNYEFGEKEIKEYQRPFIFHIAETSITQHYALFENHYPTSTGTLNILEAVKLHCPTTKGFHVRQRDAIQKQWGLQIDEQMPFDEVL
ncbi:MAG: hypothetical protein WBZ48_01200 [Bacteroidota bacterium]